MNLTFHRLSCCVPQYVLFPGILHSFTRNLVWAKPESFRAEPSLSPRDHQTALPGPQLASAL